MLTASTYSDTLVNGEPAVWITPKMWRADGTKTPVIFAKGSNGSVLEPLVSGSKALIERLVRAGFPVLSAYFGGNTWGNTVAQDRMTGALAWLTANGAKPDTFFGIGYSMGHLTIMNYAANNRSKVRGVISLMGVADMNYLHANTHTDPINAAYGGTWDAALEGPAYNPAVNSAAKYTGLPWLGYAGTTDVTCPESQMTALVNGIGSSAELVQIPGGHVQATLDGIDLKHATDFVIKSLV